MRNLQKIWKIAEANKEGFTIYLPSLEPVKNGWVIANIATQNRVGIKGLEFVIEFALNHNRIVGGYLNQSGVFQFDASIVEPNELLAIELMKLHKQDCIYNLETAKMIWNE